MEARRLSSGYWHLRGKGPCNWAQPPYWPCDEATLRAHAFPQASEEFLRECMHDALAHRSVSTQLFLDESNP